MARPLTLQDLEPCDLHVLWDLIRFGALADYQIARRYGSPAVANARLKPLIADELVRPLSEKFGDIVMYQITTRGFFLGRFGLKRHLLHPDHLGHDIAVVDLADHLLRRYPAATWRGENQFRLALEAVDGQKVRQADNHHTPDGLLIHGEKRIAIELEHSLKDPLRYTKICRWYATEIRLHEIWWFTDDPAIEARIRNVNRETGFAGDITVKYEPFPPGVVVRQRQRL
jgi:hypothetical protein